MRKPSNCVLMIGAMVFASCGARTGLAEGSPADRLDSGVTRDAFVGAPDAARLARCPPAAAPRASFECQAPIAYVDPPFVCPAGAPMPPDLAGSFVKMDCDGPGASLEPSRLPMVLGATYDEPDCPGSGCRYMCFEMDQTLPGGCVYTATLRLLGQPATESCSMVAYDAVATSGTACPPCHAITRLCYLG